MSILEGVKAANIKPQKPKFVIKDRPTAKLNRDDPDFDSHTANEDDAVQFIEYMIAKSARLHELLEKKTIFNETAFFDQHLFGSTCLKTLLKQNLDKMMADRRLGKNLKGMNKSNLTEIENAVWSVIEREAALYKNELEYERHKKQLETDLRARKEQLKQEIDRISEGRSRKGSENACLEDV